MPSFIATQEANPLKWMLGKDNYLKQLDLSEVSEQKCYPMITTYLFVILFLAFVIFLRMIIFNVPVLFIDLIYSDNQTDTVFIVTNIFSVSSNVFVVIPTVICISFFIERITKYNITAIIVYFLSVLYVCVIVFFNYLQAVATTIDNSAFYQIIADFISVFTPLTLGMIIMLVLICAAKIDTQNSDFLRQSLLLTNNDSIGSEQTVSIELNVKNMQLQQKDDDILDYYQLKSKYNCFIIFCFFFCMCVISVCAISCFFFF